MLKIKDKPFIGKRRAVPSAATVVPLALVAVEFVPNTSVTLYFNQNINIDEFDPSKVFVNDPADSVLNQGIDGTYTSDSSVYVSLVEFDPSSQPGAWVTVEPGNGIKSVDGQAWAGITQYPID